MTALRSCLFAGTVVHKRLAPRRHAFAYRVFTLALDVDEIDRLDHELRLFSRNRRNVLSFCDEDLGDKGTGTVGEKARRLLAGAGLSQYGAEITLVCYPRIFGYVFNPLSVYFCRDAAGHLGTVIYEVSNTFGERKSYVVETSDGEAAQSCSKEMYVSPFTGPNGRYSFHLVPPSEGVVIGVAFREGSQAILKTHFRGERVPLSDGAIARLMLRHPLMTAKVITAIHFEAARLWIKGVPLVKRHTSPAYSYSIIRPQSQEAPHA